MMRFLALVFLLVSFGAHARKKPNVVFVLVDDLDVVVTRPFYKDVLKETLKLKKEGVEFSNTFVSTPLCCPSRAAILSGKYAHNTNVYNNGAAQGGRWQFKDDEPEALPARLFDLGYRTAIIGKYMNGFGVSKGDIEKGNLIDPPYGWTEGHVFISKNLKKYKGYNYHVYNWADGKPRNEKDWNADKLDVEWRGENEEDYSTDYVYRKTIEFMENSKRKNDEQPFFAYVNPTCPHFPLPPAKRHEGLTQLLWGPRSFPTDRPNYFAHAGELGGDNEEIPMDSPDWLRRSWKKRMRLRDGLGYAIDLMGGILPFDDSHKGYNQADWLNRMGSLYACDELVSGLVKWLKDNDEWDDTLFIFTSDNGYNLGAHALPQKISPYEESLRVPMIVAGGKNLDLKKNADSDSWTMNIDIAPTILELATGEAPPQSMDGLSFAGRLLNTYEKPVHDRNKFLIEYVGPGVANGYLPYFATYHFRLAPAYFMDMPTYTAIRKKKTIREDGVEVEKEFLFVEWENWSENRWFKRRLKKNRKLLRKRIERRRSRGKIVKRLEKSMQKEYELFDITNDPFQLDNLLYYRPEEYMELAKELLLELKMLEACVGESCQEGFRN